MNESLDYDIDACSEKKPNTNSVMFMHEELAVELLLNFAILDRGGSIDTYMKAFGKELEE